MIHAQLDENGVCIGFSNLTKYETNSNLVYLPEGWNEDFLWRKYDGQWSEEKFLPPEPAPQLTLEQLQTQINQLIAIVGDMQLGV